MELVARPMATDLFCQVFFKEPMLEFLKGEPRISLINRFLEAFKLRLNDLKFSDVTPSNNHIHFSKFYGPSFFDVSFGLEEVAAMLRNPQNEAQVTDLFGKLFQGFEQSSFSRQRMTISQQLSTEEDVTLFLKGLNPYCPSNFEKLLHGRGVYYTLKIPEHELTIYITLVNSMFIPGGLYLSIENNFSPNLYDFKEAFRIAKERHDFILKELNLNIKVEA